jgi:hypothetical protein
LEGDLQEGPVAGGGGDVAGTGAEGEVGGAVGVEAGEQRVDPAVASHAAADEQVAIGELNDGFPPRVGGQIT